MMIDGICKLQISNDTVPDYDIAKIELPNI